jgi:hypothetical protein
MADVIDTIGTSGDYATPALWSAAWPANFVTADERWIGQLKNQTFSVSLSWSGNTTDATRYPWLTTEAGASFKDNANKLTNALRYNTSNGAALVNSGAYATPIYTTGMRVRVSGVQVKCDNGNRSALNSDNGQVTAEDCIFEAVGTSQGAINLYGGAGNNIARRILVYTTSGTGYIARIKDAAIYGSTFVSAGSQATTALATPYSASTLSNCAVFNAAAFYSSQVPTCTTCYSDAGSLPSGVTTATYNTTTGSGFENITSGTLDFRIKSTSALKDTGTTDSTNNATDIVGTARPQGSAYDVGCWEYAATGGGTTRGTPFGQRGTAFNGGRTFYGPMR